MGCAQLAVIAIRACLAALLRLSAELYGRSVQPEIGVTQYGCGKPRLLLAAAIIFCMAVAISMSLVVKLLTSDTLSTKRSADAVTLEPISLQLQRLGVSFVCIIVTVVLLYRLRCSHPKKASKRQLVQQQPGTVHTTEIPAEPLVSSENQTSAEQAVKQEDTQYLEPAKHHSSHSTKVINSRSLGLDPAALSALAEQLVAKQHPTTAGKLNGLLIRSSILHQQQQLQQGLGKRCSALYRSPVAHQSVSIKINRPPSTGTTVCRSFLLLEKQQCCRKAHMCAAYTACSILCVRMADAYRASATTPTDTASVILACQITLPWVQMGSNTLVEPL